MSDTTPLGRTKTFLGLALAAVLLGSTACGGDDGDSASAGSSGEPSSSQAPDGQSAQPDLAGIPDVVAEVNGTEVTKEEFVTTYEARFQQAAMQAQMGGGQAPDQEALKEQTVNSLVDTELLVQEADARGITATEQQVDKELTGLAKQNQMGSAEEFLAALEQRGTSEEQARAQVENQIVLERLVADEAGSVKPTEQELRELYQRAKQAQEQAGGQQQIPPFAQVRPQLEQQATAEEQGKAAQALVEELREDAEITINL